MIVLSNIIDYIIIICAIQFNLYVSYEHSGLCKSTHRNNRPTMLCRFVNNNYLSPHFFFFFLANCIQFLLFYYTFSCEIAVVAFCLHLFCCFVYSFEQSHIFCVLLQEMIYGLINILICLSYSHVPNIFNNHEIVLLDYQAVDQKLHSMQPRLIPNLQPKKLT